MQTQSSRPDPEEAGSPASVTVVTVLHNSSGVLPDFLQSVELAAPRTHVDVVAVDNASSDASASAEIVERHGGSFIASGSNAGYGAGINLGVRQAPGASRFVLISNPDVRFRDDAIDRLVDYAVSAPQDVAAFGPRILDADGNVYPSARRLPSLRTGIGHALFGKVFPTNPWTRRYRAENDYSDEPRFAEWLSGACLLMERSWFDRLGGFDERYFMYFEDVDLGARIQSNGGRSAYVPVAVVQHEGAHSTSKSASQMIHAHHASAERYLRTKYAGAAWAPVRWALIGSLRVRSAFTARTAGTRAR
jgi:N-acetylglucosaminyl-diphospho-decaprenol L-rhamnosyltransferase